MCSLTSPVREYPHLLQEADHLGVGARGLPQKLFPDLAVGVDARRDSCRLGDEFFRCTTPHDAGAQIHGAVRHAEQIFVLVPMITANGEAPITLCEGLH